MPYSNDGFYEGTDPTVAKDQPGKLLVHRMQATRKSKVKVGSLMAAFLPQLMSSEGEPRATDEALPLWTPLDGIPFDEMWADDVLWFPHMLSGRRFEGRFLFDGDVLLGHELDVD